MVPEVRRHDDLGRDGPGRLVGERLAAGDVPGALGRELAVVAPKVWAPTHTAIRSGMPMPPWAMMSRSMNGFATRRSTSTHATSRAAPATRQVMVSALSQPAIPPSETKTFFCRLLAPV